jgi:sugar fermentation stimulation protein A
MKLPVLTKAILKKRYKRFLADVVLDNGDELTVYCPNTGAMTGCAEPGSVVWLSSSDDLKRKYRYTWELVQNGNKNIICIHSARANKIFQEAIENGFIEPLNGYDKIACEVKYGEENSRIDFLLSNQGQQCFVEVKSVTLMIEGGVGLFPDAVSKRGSKHLRELIAMVEQGHRAVLVFCVLHTGIVSVAPAQMIDEQYASTLRQAQAAGVEVLVYGALVSQSKLL